MRSTQPRTVDLVVTGDDRAPLAAAFDAVQRGRRVLVVLRSATRERCNVIVDASAQSRTPTAAGLR